MRRTGSRRSAARGNPSGPSARIRRGIERLEGRLLLRHAVAPACTASFQEAVLTVQCDGHPGEANLAVISRTTPGEILFNGAPVGDATVHNTERIEIVGAASNDQITIDSSNGLFEPGLMDESPCEPESDFCITIPGVRSEIEIAVDGGGGSDAFLLVGQAAAADLFFLGTLGINFNADNDADITLAGIESVTLDGQAGDDQLDADPLDDLFIEGGPNVGGTYAGPVTLIGGSGNDRLQGGLAGDFLDGRSGKDTMVAGIGDDTLTGGRDDDSIDGGAAIDTVLESADVDFTLDDHSLAGLGSDTLVAIERAVLTGGDSDNVIDASGFSGPVTLRGRAGDDLLLGGDGSDLLRGGRGNDALDGGAGNDRLGGRFGDDLLRGGDGNDSLRGGDGEDLLIGGDGNDLLDGSSDSDALFGRRGDDSLLGGDGADFLSGGSGSDTLDGGEGFDICEGGEVEQSCA